VEFHEVLASHLLYGYVFALPNSFMLARPVRSDASEDEILDCNRDFKNPDAWFIYAASGDLLEFLEVEPFPLPYFGWQKRNRVRFWKREKVINAIRASSSDLCGC
jgi:hypothetical protein